MLFEQGSGDSNFSKKGVSNYLELAAKEHTHSTNIMSKRVIVDLALVCIVGITPACDEGLPSGESALGGSKFGWKENRKIKIIQAIS